MTTATAQSFANLALVMEEVKLDGPDRMIELTREHGMEHSQPGLTASPEDSAHYGVHPIGASQCGCSGLYEPGRVSPSTPFLPGVGNANHSGWEAANS